MLQHVLPANIDDECHLRVEGGDVSEVLLRTDSQIHAMWMNVGFQRGNDLLVATFIRQEIIGTKVSAGFRKLRDHVPEFGICEPLRQRVLDGRDVSGTVEKQNSQ